MLFEFRTVYPAVRKSGLILSDDVHKNDSFREFVAEKGILGIQFATKGGAAVKDKD
jgi:hypothetical protein